MAKSLSLLRLGIFVKRGAIICISVLIYWRYKWLIRLEMFVKGDYWNYAFKIIFFPEKKKNENLTTVLQSKALQATSVSKNPFFPDLHIFITLMIILLFCWNILLRKYKSFSVDFIDIYDWLFAERRLWYEII